MASNDELNDELNESERQALDTWAPMPPPAGFAERVLAARDVPAPRPLYRARWPLVLAGAGLLAAAAAAMVVAMRPVDQSARGALTAKQRSTTHLGDRAIAVAEPSAELSWDIDEDGAAVVEQRAGDVFYRVDTGASFVVHTPAGIVRVTGTCFRIEVQAMTSKKQLLLSGSAGAALAAAVVVTVYEGHVVAENQGARTELAAGTRATLGPGGTSIATGGAIGGGADDTRPDLATAVAALDETRATREQLVARVVEQRSELVRLRERITQLEARTRGHHDNGPEPGRAWYDPSPERLAEWAKECHIRADDPGLDRWRPAEDLGKNDRGIEPDELGSINAAVGEIHAAWKKLVRELYIEATGDVAGAETLSLEAMRGEIQEKSAPGEHNLILQKLSAERAGLVPPPADLSKTSPLERLMRAHLRLGDDTEAAIAKRLGADRAKAIRGDGWDSRSDWSGCPRSK